MYRFFLFYLVAAAAANNLGYDYQPLGYNPQIGGAVLGDAIANGIGEDSYPGGITTSTNGGFGGFIGVNDAGSYVDSSSGSGVVSQSGLTEYNKEFFTYAAPKNEFEDEFGNERNSVPLKKNLRVVFIKAPENNGLTNAVIQLAKQANDQQIAIYLFSKQPDASDLTNRLQVLKNSNTSPPEVHFVKYHSPEDAALAQLSIQAQYETLGGPSQY